MKKKKPTPEEVVPPVSSRDPLPISIPVPDPLAPHDYAKASGLDLDPDMAALVNKIMADDPREVLYQLRRASQRLIDGNFEALCVQIRAQEAERKRLWGNKYPPRLGMKPWDHPESGPMPVPISHKLISDPGKLPPLPRGKKD
jgi:hypothetical protein